MLTTTVEDMELQDLFFDVIGRHLRSKIKFVPDSLIQDLAKECVAVLVTHKIKGWYDDSFTETRRLYQAESQITGFVHAHHGNGLKDLIESMGLTRNEWIILKRVFALSHIPSKVLNEINDIFK